MNNLKERREWLSRAKNKMVNRLHNQNSKGFEKTLKVIDLYNKEIIQITRELGDGRYHI